MTTINEHVRAEFASAVSDIATIYALIQKVAAEHPGYRENDALPRSCPQNIQDFPA